MIDAAHRIVERQEDILPLMMHSIGHRLAGEWAAALADIDAALALDPRFLPCYPERAAVLVGLRRYEDAVDALDRFLHYLPDSAQVQVLRERMLTDALAELANRLAAQPNDLDLRLQRANLLWKARREQDALDAFAAILAHDPDHVDALTNQGGVLLALHRNDEALACYRHALAADPANKFSHFNLGNVLQQAGQPDAARDAYRDALALDPAFAEAQMEIAHCHFSEGDYAAAWPYYESRWRTKQMRDKRLPTTQPVWRGRMRTALAGEIWQTTDDPSLAGKTLLVWAEQGAGDTLQFLRYLAQVAGMADADSAGPPVQIILRVPASLRTLVAGLDPRVNIVGDDMPIPAHDIHCPLLSLPIALGGTAPQPQAAYLHADPARVAQWHAPPGPRPRVGLAWAGRQHGLPNPSRDLPLHLLAPLLALGADVVSLQKDIPPTDAATMASLPGLRDVSAQLHDFADTAALIASLDLVISVDTAIAHLAGALGKPCWLLLRHSGEWRWMRGREDTPWYPSTRIFRQYAPGDWAGVCARACDALKARVAMSS